MDSYSSSSSWLPLELIEEILERTQPESLIRFKSVCKQWHEIITDKKFIYKNLQHFSTKQRFIRIDYDTLQIMDPVTGNHSALPIPNEFQNPYSIDTLFHCDGLILCMCDNARNQGSDSRYTELAIWNPTLKEIKWIEPSHCFTRSDHYGIGYNKAASRGDYKILRFSDFQYDSRCSWFPEEPEVEIYEFKSDSWRTLVANLDWEVDIACKGVSAMGDMYWIPQNHQEDFIRSFDFSTETFKKICVYPPSYNNLLGCFNGDRLSLLQQGPNIEEEGEEEPKDIQVWITNKLSDEVVSFTKYFSVVHPHLPALQFDTDFAHAGYYIGKHRNIMALCEAHVEEEEGNNVYVGIIFYEIDEDGIRRKIETTRYREQHYCQSFICGYVYIPSLIPVP